MMYLLLSSSFVTRMSENHVCNMVFISFSPSKTTQHHPIPPCLNHDFLDYLDFPPPNNQLRINNPPTQSKSYLSSNPVNPDSDNNQLRITNNPPTQSTKQVKILPIP